MKKRAKAKYLGGTRVEFTCPQGHVWSEDLGRKSLPRPKRLQEAGVKLMAHWWAATGVNAPCPKCVK